MESFDTKKSVEDWITQSVEVVAQMMAVAAVTAPKAKGENCIEVRILHREEANRLGEEMIAYGAQVGKANFDRDGRNVKASDAVVLIGLRQPNTLGLNCGACGFDTCAEMLVQERAEGEFPGPFCAHRIIDMGIALGSAVKVAGLLNVDNRIMYRVGAAARVLKWVDWQYVMGIPLSVTGKSIYFDR